MPPSAEAARSFMARALMLAEAGRSSTHPNPRVGCVIVRGGEIVGEGAHLNAGEPHAEVHALRQANTRARGSDVFVTLEPCNHHGRTPPCTEALIAAGVRKVWVALADPNPLVVGKGLERLRQAGIDVEVGLMRDEAARLNRGFLMRMTHKRPFVTLKLASSLDGRTATAKGESKWITGVAAREDVHRLRAEAGAVLTSSNTVIADNPALTVRLPIPQGLSDWRQPDRIVLDSGGRVSADAKVWAPGARRFWFTSPMSLFALSMGTVSARNQVEVLAVEGDDTGPLSLPSVMAVLGVREVNEVLVESGPRLAGAFLKAGLVDEVVWYAAPSLLGHQGRALAELPGLDRLNQRLKLKFSDVRPLGEDLRITATVEGA